VRASNSPATNGSWSPAKPIAVQEWRHPDHFFPRATCPANNGDKSGRARPESLLCLRQMLYLRRPNHREPQSILFARLNRWDRAPRWLDIQKLGERAESYKVTSTDLALTRHIAPGAARELLQDQVL